MQLVPAIPHAAPSGAAPAITPAVPAPRLVAAHFAAALFFFGCGSVELVWIAPDLAAGLFYLPRVAAVVHLFTLGWIMLSIFGALCQFLPVAIGQELRSRVAAHLSLAAHVLGVIGLVSGLATGKLALLVFGASALSLSFATFALNLLATLVRATERSLTWWTLAAAALFLLVTPAFGTLLALGPFVDGLVVERFALVGQHAHIAVVGVVLLVMVGVASRLLPMFLLSHGASERFGKLAAGLLFTCAALLTLPIASTARLIAAHVFGVAGMLAFVVQAAAYFRHRKRRDIDHGMRLAAAGVVALALAAALSPFALGRGLGDLNLLTTYYVVLLGGISLFVAGHYFKIVPFIVWYHRFGPHVGTRKVPKVAELLPRPLARAGAALLPAGMLGLAVATLAGSTAGVRAAAAVVAAGALAEIVALARVAQRRLT